MASRTQIRQWQELAVRMQPYLAQIPYAAADHAALVEVLARLEAAEHEEDFLRGRLAVLRRERWGDGERARELRNRLVAFLRATFGPGDARLAHCGLTSKKKRPGRAVPIN